MNKVEFVLVHDDIQIEQVVKLADKIWHEHYADILDYNQINYMVDKFQSFEAMKEQINKSEYKYYLLSVNDIYVGYTGLKEELEEKQIFLSKLYIEKEYRGCGYGSEVFEFLEILSRNKGYHKIYLTVNRFNKNSIDTYEKKGFKKVNTQVSDIGHGYVMDDYVMKKRI